MTMAKTRIVYPMADGTWLNKLEGSEKNSTAHPTIEEAQRTARRLLREEGGGEVMTKDRDGKVICVDVVPPSH